MCLYPKLIANRRYTANQKNGGKIPPVKDERTRLVAIGCGECIECRKQKARAWQVRLIEDIKTNTNGKYITLTFSDETYAEIANKVEELSEWNMEEEKPTGYELDNRIATYAMEHFRERWRKEYKKSPRHWFVTELGHEGTENIHLHGIIWTDKTRDDIEKHWQYGYIWPRKDTKKQTWINEQTINYYTKYIYKRDVQHKTYKSKILTSPGIGSNYTNTYNAEKLKNNNQEIYQTRTGHKIALPIYWRNKIYTDEEREKLWINLLNKEERWVRGEKVSIKNGEEEYYKLLKYHQNENKKLGYGDANKDWARARYEKHRRKIAQATRIANAKNNKNKAS